MFPPSLNFSAFQRQLYIWHFHIGGAFLSCTSPYAQQFPNSHSKPYYTTSVIHITTVQMVFSSWSYFIFQYGPRALSFLIFSTLYSLCHPVVIVGMQLSHPSNSSLTRYTHTHFCTAHLLDVLSKFPISDFLSATDSNILTIYLFPLA